jgi:hypothetical protein
MASDSIAFLAAYFSYQMPANAGAPTRCVWKKGDDMPELKRQWIKRQRPLDPAKYCLTTMMQKLKFEQAGLRSGNTVGLEFLGAEYYNIDDSFEDLEVLSVEMKEDKSC